MNMNRLLTRREKDGGSHKRDKSRDKSRDRKTRPLSSDGIIALFKPDLQKKQDKELAQKIQSIKQRFVEEGRTPLGDTQISYALSSKHADGDVDRAYEIVVLFQESVDGVIKPYKPDIHMKGAENRDGTTCYLDALLFAMFARLGSFEPILYTIFEDEPRRRLSTLIRLWVNMLRTGMLIQTDVTQHLQEALAACGWEDAGKLEQQDTSEAFSFITDRLQMPLLTLRMDIYHNGKDDPGDDHKFINERLLEVAVPEALGEEARPIQLEDCLEQYFNNRVEVVRHLERSHTRHSLRSVSAASPLQENEDAPHGDVQELVSPQIMDTMDRFSASQEPATPATPAAPLSPTNRPRGTSIIRRRLVSEDADEEGSQVDAFSTHDSLHKGSVRKEVLMPAWQFFNLIRPLPDFSHLEPSISACSSSLDSPVLIDGLAWYATKSSPTHNNTEVIAHFAQMRPVLGICLKRYSMTPDGQARRQNTFIDIPLDVRLPHFVQDDEVDEDGSLVATFKLSLQSVICHRGKSVQSGHYLSFIRDTTKASDGDVNSSRRLSNSSRPPRYPEEDKWIKFDDLEQPERISNVDIEQALRDEMPYLLFYQVQPTFNASPPSEVEPPSYTDSEVGVTASDPGPSERLKHAPHHTGYFGGMREELHPVKLSGSMDKSRGSINLTDYDNGRSEARRGSVANTDVSVGSQASFPLVAEATSTPVTPIEETTAQRMSRAAARFTKSANRSRASSQNGENRLSSTFTRLVTMRSREMLNGSKGEIAVNGSSIDDGSTATVEETPARGEEPKRLHKKGGTKHDKSRTGMEKLETANHQHAYHLHHSGLHKKKNKEVPDRECELM